MGKQRKRVGLRAALLAIGILFLVGATVFFRDIVVIIRPGEAGVLWNRFVGTRIDRVYQERLHIVSPLDKMSVYEVRNQIVRHELDILTSEGLTLKLYLAIRYRPELSMLGVLHDRIGPDYLTRVVIPQTESVLRKQLGNQTAEAIYTNKDDLLTKAVLMAMEEVGRNFVEIEDIIIRRLELPPTVLVAIEDKLRQQELLRSYTFRTAIAEREVERLRIEAEGVRDYQTIVDSTLDSRLLAHQRILATQAIAQSANPRTVVLGADNTNSGGISLPIFMSDPKPGETPPPSGTSPVEQSMSPGAPPPESAGPKAGAPEPTR